MSNLLEKVETELATLFERFSDIFVVLIVDREGALVAKSVNQNRAPPSLRSPSANFMLQKLTTCVENIVELGIGELQRLECQYDNETRLVMFSYAKLYVALLTNGELDGSVAFTLQTELEPVVDVLHKELESAGL